MDDYELIGEIDDTLNVETTVDFVEDAETSTFEDISEEVTTDEITSSATTLKAHKVRSAKPEKPVDMFLEAFTAYAKGENFIEGVTNQNTTEIANHFITYFMNMRVHNSASTLSTAVAYEYKNMLIYYNGAMFFQTENQFIGIPVVPSLPIIVDIVKRHKQVGEDVLKEVKSIAKAYIKKLKAYMTVKGFRIDNLNNYKECITDPAFIAYLSDKSFSEHYIYNAYTLLKTISGVPTICELLSVKVGDKTIELLHMTNSVDTVYLLPRY